MAKLSAGIKVLIVLLSLLFLLIVGAVVVYKMELVPGLNDRIHRLLGLQSAQEAVGQPPLQDEMLRERTSVKARFPHLIPAAEETVESILQSPAGTPGAGFSKSEGYTVRFFPEGLEAPLGDSASAGDSTSDATSPEQEKSLWSYTNRYPVIAPAADFSDAVVFIDAQPALVCLDKETGAELLRIPCQVYPGGEAFSRLQSYYFRGKTGNWYEVRFEEGLTPPETLAVAQEVEEGRDADEAMYRSLLPSRTALDFIEAKMNGLLSVSPAVSIPESILYSPEQEAVSFNRSLVSPAFVFSPREQGTYTLGLCDEAGAWVRDSAFVVLYTMAGEALAISLDYVADRPQITTHLSDQELYVACAGFFPDSLIIDPAPSRDFRDTALSAAEVPLGADGAGMEVVVLESAESDSGTDGAAPDAAGSPADTQATAQRRAWFQVKVAP